MQGAGQRLLCEVVHLREEGGEGVGGGDVELGQAESGETPDGGWWRKATGLKAMWKYRSVMRDRRLVMCTLLSIVS